MGSTASVWPSTLPFSGTATEEQVLRDRILLRRVPAVQQVCVRGGDAGYAAGVVAARAACQIALRGPIRSPRYAHLRPILDTGQDKTGHVEDPADEDGGYVRGSSYYAGGAR